MIVPHLLSSYSRIALQLLQCLAGHESSRLPPINPDGEQGEPDHQRHSAHDQAGPSHRQTRYGQPRNGRLKQNHQSRDQQYRSSDYETERHGDLADPFGHLGSSELAFFANQRSELVY
jgi:hypothetical protein